MIFEYVERVIQYDFNCMYLSWYMQNVEEHDHSNALNNEYKERILERLKY